MSSAISFARLSDSISAPQRKLREVDLFSVTLPCLKTVDSDTLPMGRVSHFNSFWELYMRMSLTWKARFTITFTMRGSRLLTSASSFCRKGRKVLMGVPRQGWRMG